MSAFKNAVRLFLFLWFFEIIHISLLHCEQSFSTCYMVSFVDEKAHFQNTIRAFFLELFDGSPQLISILVFDVKDTQSRNIQ